MCLAKDSESPTKEVVSPRSPWAKLMSRQNKPKLPRKVANSARVNLNKCWAKLGGLISNAPPRTDLVPFKNEDEPVLIPFTEFFYPVDPVKPSLRKDNDNAENQNIVNDNRFEIISEEINENLANEVREICYSQNKANCFVCKLCY